MARLDLFSSLVSVKCLVFCSKYSFGGGWFLFFSVDYFYGLVYVGVAVV